MRMNKKNHTDLIPKYMQTKYFGNEDQINTDLWTFLFAGGAALLIAFITVSYQSIKVASANPITSLRYE